MRAKTLRTRSLQKVPVASGKRGKLRRYQPRRLPGKRQLQDRGRKMRGAGVAFLSPAVGVLVGFLRGTGVAFLSPAVGGLRWGFCAVAFLESEAMRRG
jgi:hypothetical protein